MLLIQIADVTRHSLSYFVPGADRPDLPDAFAAQYPDLDVASIKDILSYVAMIVERDRRRRTLRSELDAPSTGDTVDTGASQES
jgi:hypothetical protein